MGHGHKRRLAGWALVSCGAACLSLFVASRWWEFTLRPFRGGEVWIGRGLMTIARINPKDESPDPLIASLAEPRELRWLLYPVDQHPGDWENEVDARVIGFARSISGRIRIWVLNVPLWLPAAALLAPGLALLSSARKARTRAGLCPTCRYDRSTLPSHAPCPECGDVPNNPSR